LRTNRFQIGASNTNALLARQYVGGGFTAFGLVPGRKDDTFGVGYERGVPERPGHHVSSDYPVLNLSRPP
jgi:hypothetical protein